MIEVDSDRLLGDLQALAQIGLQEGGGISRTSFSSADVRARRWYRDLCIEAGLSLNVDGLGNMTASRPSDVGRMSAIWSGSHIDTVPAGGPLDGALGTVAALECLRRINEENLALPRPVRALVFTDEEGSYRHLFGSHGLVYGYGADELKGMVGRDGDRLIETWADYPFRSDQPAEPLDPRLVAGFVELHIEQGPKLEAAGLDIGVVTSIVSLGGGRLDFHGRADHAGTTPMPNRSDALLAAADLLTGLPDIASEYSDAAVATCGIVQVSPGAANVVPETVTLTLDLREPTREGVMSLYDMVHAAARSAAQRRGTTADWMPDPIVDPMHMDPGTQQVIRDVTNALQLSLQDMPSGAGHDSQNLAKVTPTAMIFVPSHDGRSHCPPEYTDPKLLVQGANVLLNTLIALAS